MTNLIPRAELKAARVRLGITQHQAAIAVGCVFKTIGNLEDGMGRDCATAKEKLRRAARYYQTIASQLGYDPAIYHESVLCPGEFDPPALPQEEAA